MADFVEDSNPTAKAYADAKSTEPEKIRAAILAIKKDAGTEGEYNFDQFGDGLHGYNIIIIINNNDKIEYQEHIEFTD